MRFAAQDPSVLRICVQRSDELSFCRPVADDQTTNRLQHGRAELIVRAPGRLKRLP